MKQAGPMVSKRLNTFLNDPSDDENKEEEEKK
jgi:hypothetical protein